MEKKKCFKCNKVKRLSDFYRHPRMADGRVNKCKECNKADVRKNRADNIEMYRAYDRLRGSRQEPEYAKEYYHKNKEKCLAASKSWLDRNPLAYKAGCAVNNAIRDGRLFRMPCKVCGSTKFIHGHHEDYSKPLDVVWLCRKHHGKRHREMNEARRVKQ